MAIVILPGGGGFYPSPWPSSNNAPGYDQIALTASTHKYAGIHRVRKTGTLDRFEFRVGTVAINAGSQVRCSFQDPSLTTGHPDTTQDQFRDIAGSLFSSNAWMFPSAGNGAMTSDGTDGGSKRSVSTATKDRICCVIEYSTFTAADSVQVSGHQFGTPSGLGNYPFTDADLGAGYVKQSGHQPNMVLKYSDGTYEAFSPVLWPVKAINTVTFSNASNPNHIGQYFNFPYPVHIRGTWVWVDPDGNFDIKRYRESDGAVMDQLTGTYGVDKDELQSQVDVKSFWPLDATLAANTNYVLMVVPTSATSVSVFSGDVNAAALMDAIPGGQNWQYATCQGEPSSPASFTKTSTRRLLMGLEVDGFDDASGAALLDKWSSGMDSVIMQRQLVTI